MGDRVKQLGLLLEDAPTAPRSGVLRSFHVSQLGGHVSVAEALEGERKAGKQDAAILEFFRTYPGRWTPSDVHREFANDKKWPLTSVRRSISNLTARGLLTHHRTDRRPGLYGAKESVWSING